MHQMFFFLLNVKELPVSISGIDGLNIVSSSGNYTWINKPLMVFDDDSRFFGEYSMYLGLVQSMLSQLFS